MKRTLTILLAAVSLLMTAGCHEEIMRTIEGMKKDLVELEQKVSDINVSLTSLSDLVSALEKNDHISSITKYSEDGRTGWRIVFSSGSSILLLDGSEGQTPIVGVRFNEERDDYYWTIQMGPDGSPTWMTNSYGQRVRATGSVPRLKIEDGIWWYSFDGTSWTKTNWGNAQGAAGRAVFSSIDTSDPYYVTFTLANGTIIHMATKLAFDELAELCKSINEDMETYTKLVEDVDPSTYVTSVVAFEEKGGDSGYRINLGSGKVLTVRNGRSNRDSVLVSARKWTDGALYWAWRNRSTEEYQWITYKNKLIPVTMKDVTPHIGLQSIDGEIYFTVSYDGGEPELMKDAKGNPVKATGRIVPDIVQDVDVSDPLCVVLTLTDGTKINLPVARRHIPTLQIHTRDTKVKPDTTYNYHLIVELNDTLSVSKPDYESYCKASGAQVEALAIDGGYVHKMNVVTASNKAVGNETAYNFNIEVPFYTGPKSKWIKGRKFRIAIFLTWGDNSIMRVVEFECV